MSKVECDCPKPDGAHTETCAHIKHVRFGKYEDDLEFPAHLRRARKAAVPVPSGGVFD